jgi:ligand-binding sensor domain-containing protein
VPQFVKSGGTLNLNAEVTNAFASVTYVWKIDSRKSGVAISESNHQLQIPEISSCDERKIVSVIATDEQGRMAENHIEIMVSKTWCTFLVQEDQLLSNHVTKLALGSGGKIWIGKDKGLNSFDGAIWEKITGKNSALGRSPSYPEGRNYINALFVQKNKVRDLDEVWLSACESENHNCVGVQGFVGNPHENIIDNWIRYSSEYSNWGISYQNLHRDTVKVINSNQGKLFIGTSAGVEVFSLSEPEANVFMSGAIYWHNQKTKKHGWFSGSHLSGKRNEGVSSLIREGDDIYIGLINGGLVRVGGGWQSFVKQDDANMPGDDISKIASGKGKCFLKAQKEFCGNSIWVATSTGLGRFIPKKDRRNEGAWESASFKSAAIKSQGGLRTDVLTDLAYDKASDTLWIATNGGGLTRLRVGLL